MGPGGSPGARLRVVEKFCPVVIHSPTTAVNNVPMMAPFAFPQGQNTEKRKRPDAGPPKAARTLNVIWDIGPLIFAIKKDTATHKAPINTTDIFAINVIVLSDNDLKFGLTTSSIANADKLLSPDERVLSDALKRDAIKSPDIPGSSSKICIPLTEQSGLGWIFV